MDCKQAELLIHAYVDGELDHEERTLPPHN